MSDREEGEQPVGKRIGPYEILEEIGRGGQGVVYLALDTRLNRRVALKMMPGSSPDGRKRFRREAEAASKISDAGICTIYDYGEHGELPYIAMEYVDGTPLNQKISSGRDGLTSGSGRTFIDLEAAEPEPVATPAGGETPDDAEIMRIVALFEKVARALHNAHESGLIHRDVKPANIMVAKSGEPMILESVSRATRTASPRR